MRNVAVLCLLLFTVAPAAWQVIPVDTAGTDARGWWTSMKVDGDDVHVAYARRLSAGQLQTTINYALSTDRGRTWTLETVDTCANYGSGYALLGWWRGGLDLESDGTPQVAYTVEASVGTFCMRARRAGPGNWDLDTVEMRTSQPLVCHDADLKIGANDMAHVVYTHYGEMTRYAVEDDTGWFRHDLALGAPYGVGLELDSSHNPHVVVGTLNDVHYAWSTDGGGTWSTERIDGGWWHVDIDLDDQCRPHVAYIRTNDHIRFARRDGPGSWTTSYVDAGGGNCCRPCIYCTPGSDNIRLAYYPTMSSSALKSALTTDRGSNWSLEQVTTTGGVYSSCSAPDIAEDGSGRYVAFQWPGYRLGFAVEDYVGIAEQPAGPVESIRVWPTLCRVRATVSLEQPAQEVCLHDASGRLVRSLSAHGRTELQLDVSDLGPGVYLVTAGAAQGRLVVAR